MDSTTTQYINYIDTIEYISKSDLSSFYSGLLSNQQGFYSNLITALAILFGLILIFTIWWHTKGVKLFIQEEVASSIKVIEDKITCFTNRQNDIISQNISVIEDKFATLNKELDTKLEQALSNVNEDNKKYVDSILKQHEETLEDFKQSTTKDLISQEAELARAFAVICGYNKDNLIAFNWWLHALEAYNEVGELYMSGVAIDNILIDLSRINFTKINQDSPINIENTRRRIINNIPDNRERDRVKILNTLDKIQQKMSEA